MEVELTEIDLDGRIDEKGIRFFGKATRRADGKWVCLADVGGALCLVEIRIQYAGERHGRRNRNA
jgi:hypothetical protein